MSRSINPQNKRDLNQGIQHLWSKFGGHSLNGWWVIAWTSSNGVNFDFEVKFDLEGQGQSPPKTIGNLTKVFSTYGLNLVILAWKVDELSRGQTWWRADGRMQATTIPEGQYWPRVKMNPVCKELNLSSQNVSDCALCHSWPILKNHENPLIDFTAMLLTNTPRCLGGRPWNSLGRFETVWLLICCVVPDISWECYVWVWCQFPKQVGGLHKLTCHRHI